MSYSKYLNICRRAAEDEGVFNTFKGMGEYIRIVENVAYVHGVQYLKAVLRDNPAFEKMMGSFATNDALGGVERAYFHDIKMAMAPTTLRYVKVLSDLCKHFDYLNGRDVVEIGGGYGGQCLIFNQLYMPNRYIIIDLPEALALQKKYLGIHGIKNVYFVSPQEIETLDYDLCISNYAFTEFTREYQNLYKEKIIDRSRNGYITCNMFGGGGVGQFSREEIIALKPNHIVMPEEPNMVEQNFIYIWHE